MRWLYTIYTYAYVCVYIHAYATNWIRVKIVFFFNSYNRKYNESLKLFTIQYKFLKLTRSSETSRESIKVL